MLGGIKLKESDKKSWDRYSIDNVSLLNHFEFKDEGIVCWRYANIGNGRLEPGRKGLPDMPTYAYKIMDDRKKKKPNTKIIIRDFGYTKEIPPGEEENFDDQNETNEIVARGSVFHCPNQRCSSKFLRYYNFQRHLVSDNCQVKRRPMTQKAYVLRTYVAKFSSCKYEQQLSQTERRHMRHHLEELAPVQLDDRFVRIEPESIVIDYLVSGWARKEHKPPTVYSIPQENFAKQLFLQGNESKKKYDPQVKNLQYYRF